MKKIWVMVLLSLVFFVLFTDTGYSLALNITSTFLNKLTYFADNIR